MDVCPECQIASPHHQQTWQLVARSYPAFASSIFRRAEENERLEQLKYAFMVSIFYSLQQIFEDSNSTLGLIELHVDYMVHRK